jgi:hypothetical protein
MQIDHSQVAAAPHAFQSIDMSRANIDKTLIQANIGDEFHSFTNAGFKKWLIPRFMMWVTGGNLLNSKMTLIYGGRDGACRAFVAIVKYVLNMQEEAIPRFIAEELRHDYGLNEINMLATCLEYLHTHVRRSIAQLINDPRGNYPNPTAREQYTPGTIRVANWRVDGPSSTALRAELEVLAKATVSQNPFQMESVTTHMRPQEIGVEGV